MIHITKLELSVCRESITL